MRAPSSRAPSAASAAHRTTVRIVPSTGRMTAWYAASAAVRRPVATAAASTVASRRKISASPRRIWERITPELPRAPISDPWAIASQTSGIPSAEESSWTTDSSVSVMFVPVSPSGTGYTFRRFSASWWMRRASRKRVTTWRTSAAPSWSSAAMRAAS